MKRIVGVIWCWGSATDTVVLKVFHSCYFFGGGVWVEQVSSGKKGQRLEWRRNMKCLFKKTVENLMLICFLLFDAFWYSWWSLCFHFASTFSPEKIYFYQSSPKKLSNSWLKKKKSKGVCKVLFRSFKDKIPNFVGWYLISSGPSI